MLYDEQDLIDLNEHLDAQHGGICDAAWTYGYVTQLAFHGYMHHVDEWLRADHTPA